MECFSFPLGFHEGSCCNSLLYIERQVRGRRTTWNFVSLLFCVCQLVHAINCHSPLMPLSVEDSQTIRIYEICQGFDSNN